MEELGAMDSAGVVELIIDPGIAFGASVGVGVAVGNEAKAGFGAVLGVCAESGDDCDIIC